MLTHDCCAGGVNCRFRLPLLALALFADAQIAHKSDPGLKPTENPASVGREGSDPAEWRIHRHSGTLEGPGPELTGARFRSNFSIHELSSNIFL